MSVYLIKRIQGFAVVLLTFLLFLIAIENFLEPKAFSAFLIMVFVAPMLYMRTNWFLIFPYSRKKLLIYHCIEAFINSGLTFLVGILLFKYHEMRFPDFDPNGSLISTMFFMGIVFFANAVLLPVKNNVRRLDETSFEKFTNKKHRTVAIGKAILLICAMILIITRNKTGLSSLVIFTAAVLLIPFAPLVPLKQLAMARNSYNYVKRACFIGSVVLLATSALITSHLIYSGDPRDKLTKYSFLLLGEVQLPLSKQRVMALALVPNDAYKTYYSKMTTADKETISAADWLATAEKCTDSDCLDGSASLIPDSAPATEKLNRFAVLMSKCDPRVTGELLRCKGIKPSGWVIDENLTLLFKSPDLGNWLAGDNGLKQLLALRALSCQQASSESAVMAKQLEKSPELFVQKAAEFYFNNYDNDSQTKDDWCRTKFKYRYFF